MGKIFYTQEPYFAWYIKNKVIIELLTQEFISRLLLLDVNLREHEMF